jgi:hypothetical protein
MKLRTIFILVAMMVVVLATSAFGVYKDSEVNDEPVKHHKTVTKAAAATAADNTVVGASGAGTSHKHSKSHLDVSEKADGPYIKDGTNTYRGTASGYDLQGDSDTEDGNGNENDSDSENQSEFQKKWKYISTMFEEIFSKWKSQETIMAPTGIEEIETAEGFRIREKFKKGARQGMRKLKNAFRGRF